MNRIARYCRGTGYYRAELPVGHPNFGKLERCPTANRIALQQSIQMGNFDTRVGLTGEELRDLSWSVVRPFNTAGKSVPILQDAYMAGHGLILMYGTYGQGKTLLLKIAAVTALTEGKSAAYANMSSVLDDIRRAYDTKDGAMTELVRRMDWWINLDVLCLDELDKVNETPWAMERLHRLLDARYTRAVRQEALTVAAANYAKLHDMPGYLRSRIEDNRFTSNGYVIDMRSADARRVVRKGSKV